MSQHLNSSFPVLFSQHLCGQRGCRPPLMLTLSPEKKKLLGPGILHCHLWELKGGGFLGPTVPTCLAMLSLQPVSQSEHWHSLPTTVCRCCLLIGRVFRGECSSPSLALLGMEFWAVQPHCWRGWSSVSRTAVAQEGGQVQSMLGKKLCNGHSLHQEVKKMEQGEPWP
jgi:hypothetical protein